MESFELNDFTLATDGVLAPVEPDGDLCLQPFALASVGQFIIEVELVAADGMADPYAGPSRFREPFDRGYYLWKYGKPEAVKDPEVERFRPAIVRSSFIYDLWKKEAAAQAEADALAQGAATRELELEAANLKDTRARSARDVRELQLYIGELTREIESDLLRQEAALLADQARQAALIVRLEENRAAARDALLLVLERQRRQNNQLLAIESVIRFYY